LNPRGPERPQADWCPLAQRISRLAPCLARRPRHLNRLCTRRGFIIVSRWINVYESFFTDEDFLWHKLVALRIKRKYNGLLFAALTSVIMSLIITFILVLVNNGWTERFWEMWLRGFIVGSLVSIPISLVVIPLVKRMVDKLASG